MPIPGRIKKLVGKVVVVIAGDDGAFTEISIYENTADAGECLKMKSSEEGYDIRAYHGVLANADILPSELNGKDCYVIVIANQHYSSEEWRGYVYSVETKGDVRLLADDIEEAVFTATPNIYNVDIDDVYVLYGYQLQLGLCINDDLFDEEAIETCKTIVKEVEAIQKEYAETIS